MNEGKLKSMKKSLDKRGHLNNNENNFVMMSEFGKSILEEKEKFFWLE